MKERIVIIPAVKKNVAFSDDLIKKLDGVMLIQRIINKAKIIADKEDILVLTDSEEISLICHRNEVRSYYDESMNLKDNNLLDGFSNAYREYVDDYKFLLILWPYAPLVAVDEIIEACNQIERENCDGLVSVKNTRHEYVLNGDGELKKASVEDKQYFVEVKSFKICKAKMLQNNKHIKWRPYVLEEGRQEIKDFHDWWVCEKLLKRKRMVFRVIGNKEVGMGHIYRALTLAHENTDHEIVFVCDKESEVAINKIAGHEYPLEIVNIDEIEEKIISLEPDLVVNDILDTDKEYVERLKSFGMKVVNFEDLGSGSKYSDLTINELFDEPQFEEKNFRWGHKYSFLREEFSNAVPHKFCGEVKDLLITFGGTDSLDLTGKMLKAILPFCIEHHIHVHIVVGSGYDHRVALARFIKNSEYKNISVTSRTGVMSSIMEKTPIAISSNGRTIYELAHMNVPAIVVAQHAREETHLFAQEKNGFVNVGVYESGVTEEAVVKYLSAICFDNVYRKQLFDNMESFDFIPNKNRVINEIFNLLNNEK